MKYLIAIMFVLVSVASAVAVEIGDDGLHKPAWMRVTFKEIQEDFADAAAEGKRLVLIVEQRGCLYCQEMHEKTFTDPRVREMLEEDYFPVQINLHGDVEIGDADGEFMPEKAAARRWGVLFTPTMIFLPTELDPERHAVEQAVAMMPGAFSAGTTFDLLTWVKEERYLDQSEEDFQRYHARRIRERADGDAR